MLDEHRILVSLRIERLAVVVTAIGAGAGKVGVRVVSGRLPRKDLRACCFISVI
jgi:hypothetical protein